MLAMLLIGIAVSSCEPVDDRAARHSVGSTDEPSRTTVYDCEMRPGEMVVKPGAEPRHSVRMSGCEMIFWDPNERQLPKGEAAR
jgi:hypothetical protein